MNFSTEFMADDGTIIPFDDVEYFYLTHDTYQNGLVLKAKIKTELCDKWKNHGSELAQKGKYGWKYMPHVKGKYNKHRNKMYNAVLKYGVLTEHVVGVNPGTPIARSWTIRHKEISGAKMRELMNNN